MLPSALWLLCLAALSTAQDSSSTTSTSSESATTTESTSNRFSFTNTGFSTITGDVPVSAFTGSEFTYLSPTGQSTIQTLTETTSVNGSLTTFTTTSSNSQVTVSQTSVSLTNIVGGSGNSTATSNSTASSTSSAPTATNTVPCNGWPEFCNRKYSNISMVAAHNAAFVIKNNAASNQELDIPTQLNDGIRMLTGEVHYVNDTLYNCHSDCSLLNAGTFQSELETVRSWLQDNPYDVLTILIVNSNQLPASQIQTFAAPFENAGLTNYLYTPSYVPQYRDQWPTLGEMIIRGQRLVVFMDYNADQSVVPWILDEFTHMWETPYSPTNQSFPCTQQRPPGLNQTEARDNYMYLANHNLNTAIDLSSLGITTSEEILIPNTAELNITNGQEIQFGRLGAMSENCTSDWGRPPNWLLVDYYNIGSPHAGSVFEVAARANGVEYDESTCCGKTTSAGALVKTSSLGLVIAIVVTMLMSW